MFYAILGSPVPCCVQDIREMNLALSEYFQTIQSQEATPFENIHTLTHRFKLSWIFACFLICPAFIKLFSLV